MRVGVLAADGFEQVELTAPMKLLNHLGAEVEVISLRPGRIRGMNLLLAGKSVRVDRVVKEADPADFDALLLPGGFVNPDLLRQSAAAIEFVRTFERAGKPIAVLCHNPQVLISAGLVQGRRLASWPGIRSDVQNAGGQWLDEPLVRDRNWVSSHGPQDLLQFQEGMVALFAEQVPVIPRKRRSAPRGASAGRWLAIATAAALLLFAGAAATRRT